MKVTGQNPELYKAMQKVMEKSPGLVTDGSKLQDVAKQLAAQGMPEASLVAKANPAELAEIRKALIADVFSKKGAIKTEALTGEKTYAQNKPEVVVSGGSYTGLTTAMRLAQEGVHVTLLESRPQHTRDIRLGMRQATLDALAKIDPELAQRVIAKASQLDPENMKAVMLNKDGKGEFRQMPNYGTELARAPDASKMAETGHELYESPYTHVIVARDFETVVEEFLKEKFPDSVTMLEGALKATKRDDGSFAFTLEKKQKDGTSVEEDFLKGKKPMAVITAEGSGSSTRRSLGIETADLTPVQYWTAGVLKTTDYTVPEGKASIRAMYRNHEVKNPETGAIEQQASRAVAISDGKSGTWLLTEMPPFYNPNPALAQSEINAHYLDVAALVTGHTEEELQSVELQGPFAKAGSQPAAFALQGRVSREASRVLNDGVVFAQLGDANLTHTFQAGLGMNTAVNEADLAAKLIHDLKSGVDAQEAASKFQDKIFDLGTAWASAGIPFFYKRSTPEKTKALVQMHLQSLADWRREGGESPLARLEKMLAAASVATEPIGPKLAA